VRVDLLVSINYIRSAWRDGRALIDVLYRAGASLVFKRPSRWSNFSW
jgi:hypothetical protein